MKLNSSKLILIIFLLSIVILFGCQTKIRETPSKLTPRITENDIQILSAQWYSDIPWNSYCQNSEKILPSADWELSVRANFPENVQSASCHYYADGVKSEYPGMILKPGINHFNRQSQFDTFNVDPKKDVAISLCCSTDSEKTLNRTYDVCKSYVLKSACK